jgi:hypothetical protein
MASPDRREALMLALGKEMRIIERHPVREEMVRRFWFVDYVDYRNELLRHPYIKA